MKLFGFEIKRAAKPLPARRSFHAANTGSLYASWIPSNTTADIDIKKDLKSIRARSRELMRNDDYAIKFKRMVKRKVVGQKGVKLQNKAKDTNGNLDKKANDLIEAAYKEHCKKGMFDVTGKYSQKEFCKMVVGTLAEDGEVLIRTVKGYDNKFRIAYQLLEADHLDEQFSDVDRNIHMGIEFDEWDRPIAYHLYKKHPGNYGANRDTTRERVPAEQIKHLFIPSRISSTRGVPWMATAMTRLKMTNGYEEAELVGARIGASKGGFYTQNAEGDEYAGDTTINGTPANEITPGEFEVLPAGWDFKAYDPQHPNASFKDFMKVVLRGISAGLDVSYNNLANDLESVNFSSLREGKNEEKEVWQDLQTWLEDNLLNDQFSEWLEMALLTQQVALPFYKLEKFNQPTWLHRGFAWVDPYKDGLLNVLLNKEGLRSHTKILADVGEDIEEVYAELQKEVELRKKYGIETMSHAEIAKIITETIQFEESEDGNEEKN
ncbi:phage portal protein [Arcobacter sp. CECT 8985]|uniref:phage portal protein n=1 Tax=Arcobacter sp. CECT 8985 TaxID=1935424 RepID=UPI0013E93C05|nr:phage portal protein [Arcobacter sp. CECT 8985]